jgi:4-hydroxy-tetrahydrodipicolinate synthase
MKMTKPLFTGVCTALVTPFLGESINYPMLDVLLQRQIDAGIEAVVLAGTTGESATLSTSEKMTLFSQSKDFVGDRLKIIAGTGSNNTRHAIELSQTAAEAGVDGLLLVSPDRDKALRINTLPGRASPDGGNGAAGRVDRHLRLLRDH